MQSMVPVLVIQQKEVLRLVAYLSNHQMDTTLEATRTSFQMFHIEDRWVEAQTQYQITECEGTKDVFLA